MRRFLGIICLILGAGLVFCALRLFDNNMNEDQLAVSMAEEYLPQIVEIIKDKSEENNNFVSDNFSSSESIPQDSHNPDNGYVENMLVTQIDEYDFIGYLEIPKLELSLPVTSETDMKLMKLMPCRFSGSPKTNDLVIGAHNYEHHFGHINELSKGDIVNFTDMEGNVWKYRVEFTEILSENEADELQNSGFPLSIYTCTYDGNSRVTVRCIID